MPIQVWAPLVVAAAALQTARNALQRGLLETAGPWGATLVRFLFGLPFALAWYLGWELATPGRTAHFGATMLLACAVAATAQTIATAALLVSMRRSGFAIGAAFSQARLPLAMVAGLAIGDWPTTTGYLGMVLATAGLFILGWPAGARLGKGDWSAAGFGLAAGALFALSANAVRTAGHAAAGGSPWLGAAATLVLTQALQSAALGLWLRWRDPRSLFAALGQWRRSFGAGFFGFAASACWFSCFAVAPAAAVNAVGVVEMPIAALAGRRLFRERLTARQILGGAMAACGVVACALGYR